MSEKTESKRDDLNDILCYFGWGADEDGRPHVLTDEEYSERVSRRGFCDDDRRDQSDDPGMA